MLILLNRDARGAGRLRGALREAGVERLVTVRECGPEELRAAAAAAALAGADAIGVAGGDGTHMTAAQELVGSRTAMLPLPAGTLNHFAIRSGVDTLETGARLVGGGRVVTRSVGTLDDSVFLNTAILGAYPDVVRRRDRLRRFMPKWPAALLAFGAAGLRTPRGIRVTLESPGGRLERRTTMVWIGVGRGSYPLAQRADEAATTLEVALLGDVSRLSIFRFLIRLVTHAVRPDRAPPPEGVELFHTGRLLIHADETLDATLDGEPRRFTSPILATVMPGALRVLVGERDASAP